MICGRVLMIGLTRWGGRNPGRNDDDDVIAARTCRCLALLLALSAAAALVVFALAG